MLLLELDLRPMKLDVEFPVTFFPAHNEEPISLFIIHYFPEDESLTF